MTNQERRDHNVIDGKRRKRIAKGAARRCRTFNTVLKQYLQMRTMMKQYGSMAARAKLKGLGKLSGFRERRAFTSAADSSWRFARRVSPDGSVRCKE